MMAILNEAYNENGFAKEFIEGMQNGQFENTWRLLGGEKINKKYSIQSMDPIIRKIKKIMNKNQKLSNIAYLIGGYYVGETLVRESSYLKWKYSKEKIENSTIIYQNKDGKVLGEINPFEEIKHKNNMNNNEVIHKALKMV